MGDTGAVFLALFLLLGNAFFVGAEFALLSARRSQIEPLAQDGSALARTTLRAMENISLVIGVNQLGITVCSLVLGAVGEPAVAHLLEPLFHMMRIPDSALHPVSFAVAMSIVVYLHVVLGEMVPKNIALASPDRAAMILGPAVWGIVTITRPLVVLIDATARGILRLVGVQMREEVTATYTREQVAAFVEESRGEGLLEEGEYGRLAGALGFAEKTVASVVLPPESLATVARGATAADVEEMCAATGFSRFPVEAEDGSLMGYLHIKDVIETTDERRARIIEDKWIRPFANVRDTELLHDGMESLQRRGAHLGRVVDVDGAFLGLVTLEDMLEELVGEIRDGAHHDEG